VLLGDDHRIVREGLKQVLADAPDMHGGGEANGHRGAGPGAALMGAAPQGDRPG
jgi:DNA-binding NarL/FixJ family response regulator